MLPVGCLRATRADPLLRRYAIAAAPAHREPDASALSRTPPATHRRRSRAKPSSPRRPRRSDPGRRRMFLSWRARPETALAEGRGTRVGRRATRRLPRSRRGAARAGPAERRGGRRCSSRRWATTTSPSAPIIAIAPVRPEGGHPRSSSARAGRPPRTSRRADSRASSRRGERRRRSRGPARSARSTFAEVVACAVEALGMVGDAAICASREARLARRRANRRRGDQRRVRARRAARGRGARASARVASPA
jgi:hypothetical protein